MKNLKINILCYIWKKTSLYFTINTFSYELLIFFRVYNLILNALGRQIKKILLNGLNRFIL
jgi:hypothetical protein